MANTVEINGKTYTERTISNIVVDGNVINGSSIPGDYGKEGQVLNLDINVESMVEANDFKTSSSEINNIETLDINTNNEDTVNGEEKESLKKRIIKWIINLLNKLQNE